MTSPLRRPLVFSILLAFLTFCPRLAGQTTTPTPPTSDAQAITILQRSSAAMGGTVPSDSTATGSITITAGSSTETGSIQILTRGVDQTLSKVQVPGENSILVYSRGLASYSDGTKIQPLSVEQAVSTAASEFPLALIQSALQNSDFSFAYVGQETIGSESAYHIQLWNSFVSNTQFLSIAPISRKDLWVDVATGLPLRLAYVVQPGQGLVPKLPIVVNYSNYQNFGGVLYPQSIQKSVNGVPSITINIATVTFNSGLSDSNFPLQ
jgi:hypothetical protein